MKKNADHKLSKRGYKNEIMMSTGASSRSKRGVRVVAKDPEDHDIGHCSYCGGRSKAPELTTKRLDLSVDYSLLQKTGSSSCGVVSIA